MPSGVPGSAQLVCPDCGGRKGDSRVKRCKPCADEAKRSVGLCSADRCDRRAATNGMCKMHDEKRRRASLLQLCAIADCVGNAVHGAFGMCPKHYQRRKRHGTPDDAALSRRPNGTGGTRAQLRNEYEASRRARKKGQFVERVSRSVVWNRDGGICHVCGLIANPDGWELDHVVPISRGGEHSYANTAVSHPKCNHLKGDRQPR